MEINPMETKSFLAERQTKLIVGFRNLAKAPKMKIRKFHEAVQRVYYGRSNSAYSGIKGGTPVREMICTAMEGSLPP
jgi:hypothetical protein